MSVEQNKATVRRVAEEVFNKGNMAVIPELIASNYLYKSPMGVEFRGPDGFAQFIGMMRGAFPDVHMTIVDTMGEGDKLSARLSLEGTFTGNLGDVKGTGKKFEVPIGMFFRFEGGKETEAVEFIDIASFNQQLGILPPGR
jgi:steroid delta-isomerase-like uncharacterized protein